VQNIKNKTCKSKTLKAASLDASAMANAHLWQTQTAPRPLLKIIRKKFISLRIKETNLL